MHQDRHRLQALDLLKGIAIIMIIIVHTRHFTLRDDSVFCRIVNFGQMGCQIFFFVSGLSLCFSARSRRSYSAFVKSRYLRIAPGFYLVLLMNFLLNVVLIDWLGLPSGFIMNSAPAAILSNLLLVHGLCPAYINYVFPGGWYIGTAFLLYLLFPALFALYEYVQKRFVWLLILLPVILWCVGFLILHALCQLGNPLLNPNNNSYLYFCFLNQLPCFSLGLTLYEQEKTDWSVRFPIQAAVLLTCLSWFVSLYLFVRPCGTYLYFLLPTLTGFAVYWTAVALLHFEKKGQLCSLPFLSVCGQNSYGMYLIHGFFCWYGICGLTAFLDKYIPTCPDLLLYALLLPVMLLCVYYCGQLMTKLLAGMDRLLRVKKRA